ncbi:helix-turn-helix domain-containing protein [Kitasatospora sp. GP82]|uniref:helix-turn-helix domain-containing protein n=1 Tax=Kitasatospora sp. GP82 TaxID=3035089 RepID=UPI002473DF76|nr:helix-turn-helix domain-containing protein [Kitasatospora sp. GP82]MDH6129422.1 DNA-binding IclR family transcriptional regulator [Kitasatospora sp. GP82]
MLQPAQKPTTTNRRLTLTLLRTLGDLGEGAHSLREIASQSRMPSSTAHHILRDAADFEMVEQVGRGQYSSRLVLVSPSAPRAVGAPLNVPASASQATRDALVTLQSESSGIALLSMPFLVGEPVRVCIDRTMGDHERERELAAATPKAKGALWRAPLGADAAGKVILAHLDPSGRSVGLPPGTPPAGMARIREEHAEIRDRGYARGPAPIDSFELVAAPIWCGPACAGSVAVLVPSYRLASTVRRNRVATAVMQAAHILSLQSIGAGAPTSHAS